MMAYDLCTCAPLQTGAGFAWECQNACNSGTGPVPDGGSSSSSGGQDAAAEAQPMIEAGSSSDASSDATGQ
jgi:hypothetical protein